jgi:hypothetical protein
MKSDAAELLALALLGLACGPGTDKPHRDSVATVRRPFCFHGTGRSLIVDLDEATGALTVDEAFRDKAGAHPGIDFNRTHWPHGETGGAVVHGALFGK